MGGKQLFAKELHLALANQTIDCAVHSLKDLEACGTQGIALACVLERADPRDVLITKTPHVHSLATLPPHAHVGTCAPRRSTQLLYHRPDCTPMPLRGNIETRLRKLMEVNWDAIILAKAGLDRLGLLAHTALREWPLFAYPLPIPTMVPAAGQGVIAVECLATNAALQTLLEPLNHVPTYVAITRERAFIQSLQATCHTPVGAYDDGHTFHTFMTTDAQPQGVYK
jgi:hydroxymethylbilane synthase